MSKRIFNPAHLRDESQPATLDFPQVLELPVEDQAAVITTHAETTWNGAAPSDDQVADTQQLVVAVLAHRDDQAKRKAIAAIEQRIEVYREEFKQTHAERLQVLIRGCRAAIEAINNAF